MPRIMFRQDDTIMLVLLTEEDIPTILPWINDPDLTQFLLRPLPLMEAAEKEWLASLAKSQTDFVFGIWHVADQKLIGSIGLHQVHWVHRTATTGTVIGEKEYWGKGYGTRAKMLLLDFAFNALDLFAIESKVVAFNGRSLKYAEKCGYQEVGRLPQWIRGKDGKRHDEVILVVTQETWQPLWQKYLTERTASTSD